MKERPMLFSAPMVRAILKGLKTQTRRVAKPVRHPDLGNVYAPGALMLEREPQHVINRACPYGQPGDRIYVRETFSHFERNENFKEGCECFYRADGECVALQPWRPAIHMPKWAARIWLEITGVRVERLQEISEADALAEGARFELASIDSVRIGATASFLSGFRNIWESTGGDWDANPWVWAIDFKVLSTTGRPA